MNPGASEDFPKNLRPENPISEANFLEILSSFKERFLRLQKENPESIAKLVSYLEKEKVVLSEVQKWQRAFSQLAHSFFIHRLSRAMQNPDDKVNFDFSSLDLPPAKMDAMREAESSVYLFNSLATEIALAEGLDLPEEQKLEFLKFLKDCLEKVEHILKTVKAVTTAEEV